MSGIHFLAGICTDDYVLLAADRACFAHGAILVSDGKFSTKYGKTFLFKLLHR